MKKGDQGKKRKLKELGEKLSAVYKKSRVIEVPYKGRVLKIKAWWGKEAREVLNEADEIMRSDNVLKYFKGVPEQARIAIELAAMDFSDKLKFNEIVVGLENSWGSRTIKEFKWGGGITPEKALEQAKAKASEFQQKLFNKYNVKVPIKDQASPLSRWRHLIY